jgi:hypothetical protein
MNGCYATGKRISLHQQLLDLLSNLSAGSSRLFIYLVIFSLCVAFIQYERIG